ncbi:AP2/ERF and B3 domain-containing transcription factor [Sesamum angolense]|uniref:AP2/ERF and B3 domain-containing transcription factor n=1 Tax=Sesamum angolense TaxID=2727404 RepID=A0AAE1X3R5_9LAMI|nr:AP2/ERF and B3 domain-containing transcription factor [Sesamum angolense]
MEEPSILSGATTYRSGEVSDSNSSSHQFPLKHPDNDWKASSSKFKGVVSQPNGHWGAQIYANHQRVWLGTFKSEVEAAMAYDSAAMKLRSGDSHRNFPWTAITIHEPKFQSQLSTEVVLSMIKDGSYAAKFSDYLRDQVQEGCKLATLHGAKGTKWRQLFQKELTPSDVSKLNRLVIPKKGWNRFVKEKGLRPRDRVMFFAYECGEGFDEYQKLHMIDVVYNSGDVVEGNVDSSEALPGQPGFDGCDEVGIEEKMDFQADFEQVENESEDENNGGEVIKDIDMVVLPFNAAKKGLRLFGVQII